MDNTNDPVYEGESEYANPDNNNTADKQSEDYLHHYQSDQASEDDLPPPPHRFDFEKTSSASSLNGEKAEPVPLASMADQVVQGIENLKTEDEEPEIRTINPEGEQTENVVFLFIKKSSSESCVVNGDSNESPGNNQEKKIVLFIKAGSDKECIGCCPFSQRLFMMLWLKGVVFNVTTVDKATKPKQLSNVAMGANPPFLLFNGEELTDIQKSEDYIEAELYPPRYPKLACKHQQSNTVGNDIFAKFSALAKFRGNPNDPKRQAMVHKLTAALAKFNSYMMEPLDDEIDEDDDSDEAQVSRRKFIDGDTMTIADCNILPKLNIIRVLGGMMLKYEIPSELTGIHRYLANADAAEEFTQTCPDPGEIVWTYGGRKPMCNRK